MKQVSEKNPLKSQNYDKSPHKIQQGGQGKKTLTVNEEHQQTKMQMQELATELMETHLEI